MRFDELFKDLARTILLWKPSSSLRKCVKEVRNYAVNTLSPNTLVATSQVHKSQTFMNTVIFIIDTYLFM